MRARAGTAAATANLPLLTASQSMEMNERTAKQPQRELGEVPQGVVVPERFGNRYRLSSQVSGQQVLWMKVTARGFPIEGWAGTCTCCIWEVPRNDRKVLPRKLYWHSTWPLQQQRTYQPEDIEPTQRGQVPKRFSRPIGRIGLLFRRRLTIDTVSSCYTDEGQLSDSNQATTIQRSKIEV